MARALLFIFLLMISGVSSAEAQERRGRSSSCEPGPITALIEIQDELGLTDAQVARLNAIDMEMARLNGPLVSQLSDVRKSIRRLGKRSEFTPAQRQQFEQYLGEVRPLLKQISDNNRRGMHQVGATLTDDQKARIDRMLIGQNSFRDRIGDGSNCDHRND